MVRPLHTILVTSAITVASLTTGYAQQKKSIHRPVAKPVTSQGLSFFQVVAVYFEEDLPSVTDYLTAHGYQFANAESGDDQDQVVFIHRNSHGIAESSLNIYFCNRADDGCAKPEIHQNGRRQHVYLVRYNVEKPVFDALQARIRAEGVRPSGSIVGDGTIGTIYGGKSDTHKFCFFINNSGPVTRYYVTLRDTPLSEQEDAADKMKEESEKEDN